MNLEDEVLEIALFSEGAELRRDGGRPWRGSLRVFQFSNIHSTDGSEVKNYVKISFPQLDGPPPVPDSFGLFFKEQEIITSEGADPPILEQIGDKVEIYYEPGSIVIKSKEDVSFYEFLTVMNKVIPEEIVI